MREILFRGKRKYTGEWVEGGIMFINGYAFIMPAGTGSVEVIPETVGQYTGLVDRNGKRIFEGDIVRDHYFDGLHPITETKYNGLVKYGAFNCSCCEGVYGWEFDNGDIRNPEGYIVIGNIHDNPEHWKGCLFGNVWRMKKDE